MAEKTSGKSAAAEAPPAADPRPAVLPMFYRRPFPLDAARHAGKALVAERSFRFAARSNSLPVTVEELMVAARQYPIVFTNRDPAIPVAVVGLRQGENLFVGEDGRWASDTYVPGYVRRYPFIFMERPDRSQYALCIDEESGMLEEKGEGERRLFVEGQPSELTRRALEFCSAYHRQFLLTREFAKALSDQGVLVERTANVAVGGNQRLALQGMRLIDEQRLREVPDDVFITWRRRNWLLPIDCILMSQSNWVNLARRSGAAAGDPQEPALSPGG